MTKTIPVARPVIGLSEIRYAVSALAANEISGYSEQYVPKFEDQFAKMCGVDFAVSVNSGTSAIHLALVALGVGRGDEVLVSAYTNMASFFPILQLGAIPVPVDVDPLTFNMDPQDLTRLISRRTKALLVVHIFGHPAPMKEINDLAIQFGVPIIEDCAEAHGAMVSGKTVGSFGVMGCFSFYANKLMTTGEGGMVTTNDRALRDSMKSISSLSFGKVNKFVHERDGYNYRISNIQAGIGLAQLERLPEMIRQKRNIANLYNHYLVENNNIQLPVELSGYRNVYWMYLVKLKSFNLHTIENVINRLHERGIEARRGFVPFSDQIHVLEQYEISARPTPVASMAGESTLYLPSGPKLSKKEIKYIARVFTQELEKALSELKDAKPTSLQSIIAKNL